MLVKKKQSKYKSLRYYKDYFITSLKLGGVLYASIDGRSFKKDRTSPIISVDEIFSRREKEGVLVKSISLVDQLTGKRKEVIPGQSKIFSTIAENGVIKITEV